MQATARILDLTRFRKRREAQRNAQLMWNMYAAQANLTAWSLLNAQNNTDFAKARP